MTRWHVVTEHLFYRSVRFFERCRHAHVVMCHTVTRHVREDMPFIECSPINQNAYAFNLIFRRVDMHDMATFVRSLWDSCVQTVNLGILGRCFRWLA